MEKRFSILYANRNRDPERIKRSFDSLEKQGGGSFEVIFVDYGSEDELIPEYQLTAADFPFVTAYYLKVQHVLWNKSKALNYGTKKAKGQYIFIADVDLIFHPETLSLFNKLAIPEKFFLFRMGYLSKEESEKLKGDYSFEQLKPARYGSVNGMILAGKQALLEVNGLDEFFHFYGAEDVDLFSRLQTAGYREEKMEDLYFYHNWHRGFQGSEDEIVTQNPRVKNIMRINQEHYFRNKDLGIIKPYRQKGMGEVIEVERSSRLKEPTRNYTIPNIAARVEHFLEEELLTIKDEIIKAEFVVDPYYKSLKYRAKKKLGKQTQAYLSLKEVNDRILKKILFNYRDANYSFEISEDLNGIDFRIEL